MIPKSEINFSAKEMTCLLCDLHPTTAGAHTTQLNADSGKWEWREEEEEEEV